MTSINAELAKIAINTYVTMKISFANLVAAIAERMPDGDSDVVTTAIGLDSRIGGKYLKGGLPFGGPCFPRDNRALSSLARGLDLEPTLSDAVDLFNSQQVEAITSRIAEFCVDGPITILGLSYKAGSPVLEASPALAIATGLLRAGRDVRAYDSSPLQIGAAELPEGLRLHPRLVDALRNTAAVVVCHPDPEFASQEFLKAPPSQALAICSILAPLPAISRLPAGYRSRSVRREPAGSGPRAAQIQEGAQSVQPQTRVLITGAGGFIGWHLTRYLKRLGYFVRGVDIKAPEYSPTEADEFILGDLRSPGECATACAGMDEVYALAADMGGMGFISAHHAEILHNNALIDINTIEAANSLGQALSVCIVGVRLPLGLQTMSMPGRYAKTTPFRRIPRTATAGRSCTASFSASTTRTRTG
jgi:hypothetical protein